MTLEARQDLLERCDEKTRWLLLSNNFLNPEKKYPWTVDRKGESFLITLPSHRDATSIAHVFVFKGNILHFEANGGHYVKVKFSEDCAGLVTDELKNHLDCAYKVHGISGLGPLPGFEMHIEYCN